MKTVTSAATAYEAPQAERLLVRIELNFLVSETGTASGQNVTMLEEEDFDEFFM